MTRIIKQFFIALLFTTLAYTSVAAQTTVTAASCNQSDVNAVINGPTHTAVSGDTINIPAGSCTWSSGITLSSVAISIIGAGQGSTTITDALNDGATPLFNATSVPVTSYLLRFSSMTIQPGSGVTNGYSPIAAEGVCSSSTCPNIRVDNINFGGWSESSNGNQADWLVRVDNFFGVLDHNTVSSATLANVGHSAYLGVGNYGDNSYATPDSFGTANALYLENNTFTNTGLSEDCDETPPGGSVGGCRIVVRFNTWTNASTNGLLYVHGTESSGRSRGGRQAEFYGNTATCQNTQTGCQSGSSMRSGVLRQFGNTFITASGSWFNAYVMLDDYRTFASIGGWGQCDGTGTYDQNDGTVYASGTYTGPSGSTSFVDSSKSWTTNQWAGSALTNGVPYSLHNVTQNFGAEIASNTATTITVANYNPVCNWGTQAACTWNNGDSYQILRATMCIDQPSRGAGTLLSGWTDPTPAGSVGEVLDPSYDWLDTTQSGSTVYNKGFAPDTAKLIPNRDFYNYTSSFNGTSGVGSGTLANRPATCTTGVAYWATDQGNWNTSGNGFGQGVLYQCSATNTWTAYYTPYTYPHPLEGGTATSLAPPTNVQAVGH